jgi:hypothetical protein
MIYISVAYTIRVSTIPSTATVAVIALAPWDTQYPIGLVLYVIALPEGTRQIQLLLL